MTFKRKKVANCPYIDQWLQKKAVYITDFCDSVLKEMDGSELKTTVPEDLEKAVDREQWICFLLFQVSSFSCYSNESEKKIQNEN